MIKKPLYLLYGSENPFFYMKQFPDRFWLQFWPFWVPFWMQNGPNIDPESDVKTIMFSDTFLMDFELLWGPKGTTFSRRGRPLCSQFRCFCALAPSYRPFLTILGPSWPFWPHFGPIWLILGFLLGAFWTILDPSGEFVDILRDHFGPFRGSFVWLMLKVLDFKNPSACFRHGGGTGAHAPLDSI